MDRINSILKNPDFINFISKNQKAEADRIYCRHDLAHFLDVSRIARILSLEEKLDLDTEIIYATGLLHDIGRWMEYESGFDHAAASKELAGGILQQCGFLESEINEIISAIGGHRNRPGTAPLADILYRADKLSRNCTQCDAVITCKRFQNGEKPYFQY